MAAAPLPSDQLISLDQPLVGTQPATQPVPVPPLIRCKRCTFRGTIDNFPLKLNGTDRTTACANCVKKNREESRAKRRREAEGNREQIQSQNDHGPVVSNGGNSTGATDVGIPGAETTLASAVASTSTIPLPLFPSAIASPSSPASSSRRDRTRRNVGRSAFPETHLSWYAFIRAITRGPEERIDVHASISLRGIQMFGSYLNVQSDPDDGTEFVVVDGKREPLDAAAWALARLVSREVWRITGYRYIYKSRSGSTGNPGRHNSHFHCAQNDAEKRAKRSRVNVQKKRMPRFDCGGYLNIITDERDLTQVNVTLTHAIAHTRYADRPDDVPLEETPWLLDPAGVEDHLHSESDHVGSYLGAMQVAAPDRGSALQQFAREHIAPALSLPAGAVPGSQSLEAYIDPSLHQGMRPAAHPATQVANAHPQSGTMSNVTPIPLPSIMALHNSSSNRISTTLVGQPSDSRMNSSTFGLQTVPAPTAAVSSASTSDPAAVAGPGRNAGTGSASGGDRIHITPEEYLKYQQAYQIILNQLSSSEGMDAKRYEKVGSMLKWIEQVGKIFEQEKQGLSSVL